MNTIASFLVYGASVVGLTSFIIYLYIRSEKKNVRLEIAKETYEKRDKVEKKAKKKSCTRNITTRRAAVREWVRKNVPNS